MRRRATLSSASFTIMVAHALGIQTRRHQEDVTSTAGGVYGHCGATVEEAGDCTSGNSGSWPIEASMPWHRARSTCRVHCASCSQCRFISYSPHHRDCSWYAVCDLARLDGKITDFRSEAMEKQGPPLRLARVLSRRQAMPTRRWAALSTGVHAQPFMVQIGANDHSQDQDGGDIAPRLLQRGWSGLLVERNRYPAPNSN